MTGRAPEPRRVPNAENRAIAVRQQRSTDGGLVWSWHVTERGVFAGSILRLDPEAAPGYTAFVGPDVTLLGQFDTLDEAAVAVADDRQRRVAEVDADLPHRV